VALLFAVGLYYVRRDSLNATVAAALLVGAANIGLILALSALAFAHVRPEYLALVNVPFVGGRPFEPALLGSIFGVIWTAYFGHMSVSNCSRTVLRRDPGGRSLIWGCMAAQIVATAIYSIWILAVNGAVDPRALAAEAGTALVPLAGVVGVAVQVLGSIFVILGMGMTSIHVSLGLYNVAREWLAPRGRPALTLPRRRGRLVLAKRRRSGELHLVLTYLGLQAGGPRLRLDMQAGGLNQPEGRRRHVEISIGDRWAMTDWPAPAWKGERLALEVVQAGPQALCLQIDTSLGISYEGEWDTLGIGLADVLPLADTQRRLITWLMRRRAAGLADVAAYLGQDEDVARDLLALMADEGLVGEVAGDDGARHYQVLLGSRRGRPLPPDIWQALGQAEPAAPGPSAGRTVARPGLWSDLGRAWDRALNERSRTLLAVSPIALAFVLAEWALLTGSGSFSGLLSFMGMAVMSLLAGIFPVLLLISSRRKGEFRPGVVYRWLGNPVLLAGIYLLSLSSLFLHGLVIWTDPVQRAGALFVGVVMLVVTFSMARRGAFAPRAVVEVRQDMEQAGAGSFAVMAAGEPLPAGVRLEYAGGGGERRLEAAAGPLPDFAALRCAAFDLPAGPARELKVWAHRVKAGGESEGLAGRLEVRCGDKTAGFDLGLSGEQVLLPHDGAPCRVEITLSDQP
jgi:hypothetical protein